MKKSLTSFAFLFLGSLYAQVNLIYTGTSSNIFPIFIQHNNIVINGSNVGGSDNYLVKSYNDCNTFIPLTIPSPFGYQNLLYRVDTSTLYLMASLGISSNRKIYKSTNGGQSWTKKLDTSGLALNHLKFFDAQEGISTENNKILRTKNGGNTWVVNTSPFAPVSSALEVFDSLVCLGVGDGTIVFSKNRGYTWTTVANMSNGIATDFFFLNKDTIFGVSTTGFFGEAFVKSTNRGKNWKIGSISSECIAYAVHFKSAKEGYVIGQSWSDSLGIILKTTDLGETWASYKTPFKEKLYDIALLNDSLALISGTKGLLFTWRYKETIFTGFKDYSKDNLQVKIFPNPVKDKFVLQYESTARIDKLSIINTLGQEVYVLNAPENNQEIDVGFLEKGIYYLKIESNKGQKIVKIVKE